MHQRVKGCKAGWWFMGGLMLGLAILAVSAATAAEETSRNIELQLTESFYRALRAEGAKTYRTDASDEYLRQIAVAARYTVETNLKLLKGQERVTALLEQLVKQSKFSPNEP